MTRMRAPERRRQLLEVAADLFAKRGYRGTTTAELAAEAGVTEPVLYRHFDSKHDLFVTLVEEVGAEVIAAWAARLAETTVPRDRLRILLAGNPATHARGAGVYRVIFQAMTETNDEPAISRAIKRHLARLHAFLESELESLQTAGIVRRDEKASALAWMLVHVAIGYGLTSGLGGRVTDRTTAQTLLEELLRG